MLKLIWNKKCSIGLGVNTKVDLELKKKIGLEVNNKVSLELKRRIGLGVK